MSKRILLTGASGYLAARLIEACRKDPEIEWLEGIDIREPANTEGWRFIKMDVRSPDFPALLKDQRIDTVVHLAWIFNPTHDPKLEYQIDVVGSRNVLAAIEAAHVPYLIYLSSTTSYGPHPDNPTIFDETYPRRGHAGYLYSKYKAEVDQMMVEFIERHPDIRVFLTRVCIVLGPNTRNVVTAMTELPVLVGVAGYDPPMQFLHEEDLQRLLIWAVKTEPVGIFNIGGRGTISYNRLMRSLRKPSMHLPSWLVYPAVSMLWKTRRVSFPPSILDFIRYPWVADTGKFHSTYDFQMLHTSEEALMAFARARWPQKFQ